MLLVTTFCNKHVESTTDDPGMTVNLWEVKAADILKKKKKIQSFFCKMSTVTPDLTVTLSVMYLFRVIALFLLLLTDKQWRFENI